MPEELNSREAVEYLKLDKKSFENYFKNSGEIKGTKKGGRFYFEKAELDRWRNSRDERIEILSLKEYEDCFEFAMEIVYGGSAMFGMGRQRSEMEAVDNWITGIIVERALKKFLKRKYSFEIVLDEEIHPGTITPKDIIGIKEDGKIREPKKFVGVKSCKFKNAFLIADEHGLPGRSADIYILGRVDIPSDHLFRILRDHSFFKRAKDFLEKNAHKGFRQIKKLKEIRVWICGYVFADELDYVDKIPGQDFSGEKRHVKSVAKMHNSDKDWKQLLEKL